MYVGSDGPHEKNHDADCRRTYAALSQYLEISGVNLNPHEQDNSFLTLNVRTLSNMTYPCWHRSLCLRRCLRCSVRLYLRRDYSSTVVQCMHTATNMEVFFYTRRSSATVHDV
ncbi:unnamed protein product [Sphacelaria rigidula]